MEYIEFTAKYTPLPIANPATETIIGYHLYLLSKHFQVLLTLGKISLVQAIPPIVKHFFSVWSVVWRSDCRLSYSCILLKRLTDLG